MGVSEAFILNVNICEYKKKDYFDKLYRVNKR